MERLDKNLWYRVKRFAPQPNLMYDPITDNYRKTGIMRKEASTQDYSKIVSGKGDDKNVSFQMPKNNLQPILPQRTFKDLEPLSRITGRLDITKSEKQQTSVVKSLQGVTDLIRDFISTPKLDANGNPVIDPITNLPVMEQRSLSDILTVSQEALFKALKDNNIAPTRNISTMIQSFTSVNVLNVLAKLRAIIQQFPNITKVDKEKAFSSAIISERMNNLSEAPEGMEAVIGEELVDEKITDFTDNWDTPYTADMFPTQGFTPGQWDSGFEASNQLREYILARRDRNPGDIPKSIHGNPLKRDRDFARQFAPDRQHIFDLDTLRFVRSTDPIAATLANRLHS